MTILIEQPAWSKSKVSALKECSRKFYFSSLRSSVPDDIERLKKLKNRHLWVGGVIHEAVGGLLKLVRQRADLPAEDAWTEEIKLKMREQFKESKENIIDKPVLFEHHYNIQLNPAVWQTHWQTVEKSLRWFYKSKWMARFKEVGPEVWKAVDDLMSFEVDGVKAWVKMDCAIETGGRFILIDWKTSAPKPSDEFSLQVAALYAHDVWGAEPESIDAIAVSLLDGQQMKATINEETLMEAQMRIQEESAKLLEEMDRRRGEIDPLTIPMPSAIQTCVRCNFQSVCHPSGIGL